MSADFIILRHELAATAIASIKNRYGDKLVDIQAVQDGDGKQLKTIHWGAFTPRFAPKTSGNLPQWFKQDIILELRASVDYFDRSLDSRYLLLLEVFEDFCALPTLRSLLSNENIVVQSPPDMDEGEESIENGRYVTTYRLRCSVRGRVTGE